MSVLFTEGWELYESGGSPPPEMRQKWGQVSSSSGMTTGRFFGNAMQFTSVDDVKDICITPFFAKQSSYVVGFNMKRTSSFHIGEFLRIYDDSNVQITFWSDTVNIVVYLMIQTFPGEYVPGLGNLRRVATFENAFNSNDWFNFQFKITIHPTAGSIACKVNDVLFPTVSNIQTSTTGTSTANAIALTSGFYNTFSWIIDDFWICDTSGRDNNDWLGVMAIQGVKPTAIGSFDEWTTEDGVSKRYFDESAGLTTNVIPPSTIEANITYQSVFDTLYQIGDASPANNGVFRTFFAICSVTNFYDIISSVDSYDDFRLGLTAKTIGGSARVKVHIGNLVGSDYRTNPTNARTLFNNKSTAYVDFNIDAVGDIDVDVSSLVDEWISQSGIGAGWDIHFIIYSPSVDTFTSTYTIADLGNPRTGYLSFKAQSDSLKSVQNPLPEDYILTSTDNAVESYQFEEASYILSNIKAIVPQYTIGNKGTGTKATAISYYNGEEKELESIPVTSITPKIKYQIFNFNPSTNRYWTKPQLTNVEIGIKLKEE